MLFRISTLLLLSIVSFVKLNFAQCSIKKNDSGEENILLTTSNEKIYRNEDLENGLQAVYAQSFLAVNKSNTNQVKFEIIISYANSRYKRDIVPREVTFLFESGTVLQFTADDKDSEKIGEADVEICYFRISLNKMQTIKENAIRGLSIKDNRTSNSLKINPYNKIFQEQIECLMKEYNRL